jgi:hypothetical protein
VKEIYETKWGGLQHLTFWVAAIPEIEKSVTNLETGEKLVGARWNRE